MDFRFIRRVATAYLATHCPSYTALVEVGLVNGFLTIGKQRADQLAGRKGRKHGR